GAPRRVGDGQNLVAPPEQRVGRVGHLDLFQVTRRGVLEGGIMLSSRSGESPVQLLASLTLGGKSARDSASGCSAGESSSAASAYCSGFSAAYTAANSNYQFGIFQPVGLGATSLPGGSAALPAVGTLETCFLRAVAGTLDSRAEVAYAG